MENPVVTAYGCRAINHNMIPNHRAFCDTYIRSDYGVRTYLNTAIKLCFGIDDGGWMDTWLRHVGSL